MTDKKQTDNPPPIDPEKVEKIGLKIAELIGTYGNNLNVDHINEILDIICATENTLINGTSREDNFFSLADIEGLLLEQNRLIQDSNLKNLFTLMKRLLGEEGIVLKKNSTSVKKA
ncbi:MAG: hypothetical protein LBJ61_10800 [Deltaproteobacteria bacterium]|jgi:hypothetical protein|nr:hypothetical protein [Deltaproteobacteria bacterium]